VKEIAKFMNLYNYPNNREEQGLWLNDISNKLSIEIRPIKVHVTPMKL
jgi:hypothetical protein